MSSSLKVMIIASTAAIFAIIRQALASYLKAQTEAELPRPMLGLMEHERRPSAWLAAGK